MACEIIVMGSFSVPLNLIFYLADLFLNGWYVVIFVILTLIASRELKEFLTDTLYKKQRITSPSIVSFLQFIYIVGFYFYIKVSYL